MNSKFDPKMFGNKDYHQNPPPLLHFEFIEGTVCRYVLVNVDNTYNYNFDRRVKHGEVPRDHKSIADDYLNKRQIDRLEKVQKKVDAYMRDDLKDELIDGSYKDEPKDFEVKREAVITISDGEEEKKPKKKGFLMRILTLGE